MSSLLYREPSLRVTSSAKGRLRELLDLPAIDLLGLGLIVFVTFLNLANVAVDKDKVGIDAQVMLKLLGIGVAGIYGGLGFITDRRIREVIQTFPMFWMVIITGAYLVAAPFSITPKISMVSTIALIAVGLMTVRAIVQIGILPVLNAIFVGMAFFNILSWVVYFAWPEVGVLKEPLPEGKFAYRMSGLAHSNTLGQYAGLTVVMGTVMYFTLQQKSWLRAGLIFVALGALVNSLSRTSLVATVFALMIGYRHVFFKKEYLTRYLIVACAMILGLMVLSTQMDIGAKLKDKMSIVSKSGDAEELTSATGRADIWAYTLHLLAKRPMTGYGAATSKYYLEQYSYYTHNLILNVAFSTGIVGGLAALLMVLGRIRDLFRISHPLADAIVAFIAVNGLFENVLFSILAGMPTMVWLIALAWPILREDPLVKKDYLNHAAQRERPGKLPSKLRFQS